MNDHSILSFVVFILLFLLLFVLLVHLFVDVATCHISACLSISKCFILEK